MRGGVIKHLGKMLGIVAVERSPQARKAQRSDNDAKREYEQNAAYYNSPAQRVFDCHFGILHFPHRLSG